MIDLEMPEAAQHIYFATEEDEVSRKGSEAVSEYKVTKRLSKMGEEEVAQCNANDPTTPESE